MQGKFYTFCIHRDFLSVFTARQSVTKVALRHIRAALRSALHMPAAEVRVSQLWSSQEIITVCHAISDVVFRDFVARLVIVERALNTGKLRRTTCAAACTRCV